MIKTKRVLDLLNFAKELKVTPTYSGAVDYDNLDRVFNLEDKDTFTMTVEIPKGKLKNTKALSVQQLDTEEYLIQTTLKGTEVELQKYKLK